jgi:hypothetical protein
VRRLAAWLAPVILLAGLTVVLGYRAFARRPVSVRAAGGDGAVATAASDRRRVAWAKARAVKARAEEAAVAAAPGPAPPAPESGNVAAVPVARARTPRASAFKPEENKVRSLLEPMVKRRENTDLRFVVCEPFTPRELDEGAEPGPLDTPPRNRSQPICRARVHARDPQALREVVREASAAYSGHLAVEVREHMDAYLGRWFEADLRVETDEAQPLPSDL